MPQLRFNNTHGNVLFVLLTAVLLVAALTYAIMGGERGGSNLSKERETIAANSLGSFGVDLHRAVDSMIHAGKSESLISFAHSSLVGYGTPDTSPETEIFNIKGGGAAYLEVPEGINNGNQWEFYGFTAIPGIGDEASPDLIMLLPNVTESFCRTFNRKAGYNPEDSIPTDSAVCLHDTSKRFTGIFASGIGINVINEGTFHTPAYFACVACPGPVYHAYYVLMDR